MGANLILRRFTGALRRPRFALLVAAAIVFMPLQANAKCFLDGQWYENDHPKCIETFGEPEGDDEDGTASQGSASTEPEPSGPSVNAGYVACRTWDLFEQWSTAHANDDGRAMSYLLDSGCARTQSSWEISILDRGWTSTKIRIYTEGGSVTMWTYMEAVSE